MSWPQLVQQTETSAEVLREIVRRRLRLPALESGPANEAIAPGPADPRGSARNRE